MKSKTLILGVLFIIGAYCFGIATGHYRYFPFDIFFEIKQGVDTNSKRNLDIDSLVEVDIAVSENTGIYLTYGQSNSVNHGQIGYDVRENVYQFLEGKAYLYHDPSLGGTGKGGSVWGIVGDKLIENGNHESVIFSNNGWQGKRLEELIEDPYITYLINSYQQLLAKYGRVDAILFHQGEINHSMKFGNENYYEDFKILLQKLYREGIHIPIYLSRTSICNTPSDSSLIDIQNKIIKDFEIVHEGPNTDLLFDKKYRLLDYCHFSMLGYKKFSDMWVKCLTDEHIISSLK
ncbi:hypothetical protein ACNKXS_07320 [Christiangramia marina]|uniref:hypothetical protein n=1 Tax=Christiangramia marina TaxID=409436 RepID=UPI003AA86AF2